MIHTAPTHELHLLNKRVAYIDQNAGGPLPEADRSALLTLNSDTRDIHALIYTLQHLRQTHPISTPATIALERAVLAQRIRQLSAIRNLPRPFYDFGDPEFETLDALINTLNYIRSMAKRR